MYYRILYIFICLIVFPVTAQAKTLLVLGDSLSAAYGIPVEQGWVSLLEQRLDKLEFDYRVVNASISGETTLGAKTRLTKLLQAHHPTWVIIELGANDGLRGFALNEIAKNLSDMITEIRQSEAEVLLVPMRLPPNYGAAYNDRFMAVYKSVAEEQDVNLSAFILKDIAQYPELMQADGLHPKQAAQKIMLENLWPSLEPMISK